MTDRMRRVNESIGDDRMRRYAGGGGGSGDAGVVTTTLVLHVAMVPTASRAVQSTFVEPTGKSDPDAGEQLALTGATPPEAVGLNVTVTGEPVDDVAVGTGHRIASGLIVGATPTTSADGALRLPERS